MSSARWIVRVGAILILASVALPHLRGAGGFVFVPASLASLLVSRLPAPEGLFLAAGLLGPALAGLVLGLGALPGTGPHPAMRWTVVILFLAASFALATLGSILLTALQAHPVAGMPSFLVALLLFLAPILLGGTVLARVLGGSEDAATAALARASLGVLLALHGLFLADFGAPVLLSWLGESGAGHALVGAWAEPLGGLLVAAGELTLLFRPAPAAPPLPVSGA